MTDVTHITETANFPLVVRHGATRTMDTMEIARLCETRHNQIIETVERLFDRGILRESRKNKRPFPVAGRGRPTEVYDLTMRDSLVVVSGYDDEIRARVIDRWAELEGRNRVSFSDSVGKNAREARLQFRHHLGIAKMIGLSGNKAVLSANMATVMACGFDTLAAMGQTHLISADNTAELTPSDIAKRLEGDWTSRRVNIALVECGYQESFRDAKGHIYYELTEKGLAAGGQYSDTGKRHSNGTPIRQLKWSSRVVDLLTADLAAEASV